MEKLLFKTNCKENIAAKPVLKKPRCCCYYKHVAHVSVKFADVWHFSTTSDTYEHKCEPGGIWL